MVLSVWVVVTALRAMTIARSKPSAGVCVMRLGSHDSASAFVLSWASAGTAKSAAAVAKDTTVRRIIEDLRFYQTGSKGGNPVCIKVSEQMGSSLLYSPESFLGDLIGIVNAN